MIQSTPVISSCFDLVQIASCFENTGLFENVEAQNVFGFSDLHGMFSNQHTGHF